MNTSGGKTILTDDEKRELEGYDFQFENIVLEGGCNIGLAYIGAVRLPSGRPAICLRCDGTVSIKQKSHAQVTKLRNRVIVVEQGRLRLIPACREHVTEVFEELGICANVRRFAGASFASVMASLLAVGFNSQELQELFDENMSSIIYDAKHGMIEKVSNFYRKLGVHPGKKVLEWLGDRFREKCGNPDVTFKELYQKYGRELCVTAVSLNKMDAQYFHVKTTPDMPIRLAVRASTTIPGLMVPLKFKVMSNDEDVYVDGGLLCKYPISCYDGWYLSMASDDSFLQRIDDLFKKDKTWNRHNWFRDPAVNTKTVGFVMYANRVRDVLKKELEERRKKYCKKCDIVLVPDTHISRRKSDEAVHRETLSAVSENAVKKLMNLLKRNDMDASGTISREEFRESMSDSSDRRGSFTNNDFELLFSGSPADADAIFDQLDANKNGEIEFSELLSFAERHGLDMMEVCRGYERRASFDDIGTLFKALFETLVINANRASEKNTDLDRTVGINTHYLHGLDFHMEEGDKQFMMQCGKQGAVCFLRSYIATNKLQKQPRRSDQEPITHELADNGPCREV